VQCSAVPSPARAKRSDLHLDYFQCFGELPINLRDYTAEQPGSRTEFIPLDRQVLGVRREETERNEVRSTKYFTGLAASSQDLTTRISPRTPMKGVIEPWPTSSCGAAHLPS
jgi:hypothetical protein